MNHRTVRRFAAMCVLTAALFLAASFTQGGCGSDKKDPIFIPPPERPDVGGTVYNSAASVGDLLTYEVNISTLEYSYLVSEGLYAGEIGCGTLIPEPGFGTYVYTNADCDTIVLLPNQLVLVGTEDNHLIAGVPELATTYNIPDIVGMYNYIDYGIDPDSGLPESEYGTFEVMADGTWQVWNLADGSTSPLTPDDTGTWVDRGDGIIELYIDGGPFGLIRLGSLMIYPTVNGNLIVADINLVLFGSVESRGLLMGVKQQTVTSGSYDGIYDVLETDEDALFVVTVNGTDVTSPFGNFTLSYNSPWTGMITDGADFTGMMSPDGIFLGVGIPVAGEHYALAAIKE